MPINLDIAPFPGGELGIRTLGPFRDTAFRVLHHRPLGQLSIFYFLKHRLARYLDKCKISMQDKREKFRYTPRIQPRVKPNPADESARKPQTFECGPAGRLGTSPCSLACEQANLYYNRFGGPRQRETRHKTAAGPGPVKPAGKRRGFATPAARRAAGWGKALLSRAGTARAGPARSAPRGGIFSPSPPGAACPRPGRPA